MTRSVVERTDLKSMTLSVAALTDLKRSGISVQLARKLGVAPHSKGYTIPYFSRDGARVVDGSPFFRIKLIPAKGKRKYHQNPGTGNHLYFPQNVAWEEMGQDIYITEGEKKAIAGCEQGYFTIGLGGVHNWLSDKRPIQEMVDFPFEGRSVSIVFDSDKVTNTDVLDAETRLANYLLKRGARVYIVDLPRGPKGLDDFLVGGGTFDEMVKREHVHKASNPLVEAINQEAFFNRDNKRIHVLVGGVYKPCALKDAELFFATRRHPEETVTKGTKGTKMVADFPLWLVSPERREYDREVFNPREDHLPTEYNSYPGILTKRSGRVDRCKYFLEFVRETICSSPGDTKSQVDEKYTYVMGWLGHLVQKPWELPGTMIILTGKQGIGKGFFVSRIIDMLGRKLAGSTLGLYRVSARFNGSLAKRLLMHIDEMHVTGKKDQEVLKNIMTDPDKTVELKWAESVDVPNFTRYIGSTNDENPVPIPEDNRRFVIYGVSTNKRNDERYFDNLRKEMEAGGYEDFMEYLMRVDLSMISLKILPQTAEMAIAAEYGELTDLDVVCEMVERLTNVQYPLVTKGGFTNYWSEEKMLGKDLFEVYLTTADRIGAKVASKSSKAMAAKFAKYLGPAFRKPVRGGSDVGGCTLYQFADGDTCRNHLRAITGRTVGIAPKENVIQ